MDKFEQALAKVDGFIAQYPSVTQYGKKSSVFPWAKFSGYYCSIIFKCVYV